jgi:hypothetical protein
MKNGTDSTRAYGWKELEMLFMSLVPDREFP